MEKQTNYHTIVTHKHPHPDEVLGIICLRKWGNDKYPGIEDANVEFWDAGVTTPDGKSWKEWHRKGYLLVGVGGSCFDEHTTNGRKKETCAALLIAEDLGIDREMWMKKTLDYVVSNDLKGGNNPFDIAAMIRLANEQWFDTNPQETLDFAIQMLMLKLNDQRNFFITVADEFNEYAKVTIINYDGKKIKGAFIESDNTKMGAYARSEFGGFCDIVVVRNQKGNVIITTNKRPIDLSNVICGLRDCEAKIKGKKVPFDQLTAGGTSLNAEEWYYDVQANQILNGSKSASSVPPSKIKTETLKRIILDRLENTTVKRNLNVAS